MTLSAMRFPGLYALFALFVVLNIGLWSQTHEWRATWGNVPPVMSERGARAMTLGDPQFSYRIIGLMIQNLGDTGGRSTALKDYNYDSLRDWFFLEDKLDPVSNYIPYLAAFYFAATQNPKQLGPVIEYLEVIGQRKESEKWRWLAQAVYLARYKQGDLQKALDLAETLSKLDGDLPLWARSMPAFVMRAQGDKQAAYAIMMGILSSGINNRTLDPFEIRFLRDNICDQTLSKDQAKQNPLCTGK